jgi:ABC-type antimicrobial peptide transport system permease subunit
LVIGLAGAFAVTRVLTSALVEVSPSDPATYGIATMVLSAAAAFGCLIPARRAMRVNPIVALCLRRNLRRLKRTRHFSFG